MALQHYIVIGNKKYGYELRPERKLTVLICKDADIREKFPNEQLPEMLMQLPQIIVRNIASTESQSEVLRFRVTQSEKEQIIRNAVNAGYNSISAFMRDLALANGPPK